MTVYKAIKKEADAASQVAIALAKKTAPPAGLVNGKSNDTSREVPSVLLKPVTVTKANIKDTVIADGFLKPADICTGKFTALCKAQGIQ
jgi:D-xylose transport system substrate-binding protein